jgi:hypothetical protein
MSAIMNTNNTNIVKGFATGEGERTWLAADKLTFKPTATNTDERMPDRSRRWAAPS